MTYNEIIQALTQGLTVYFSSSLYIVMLDNGKLHTLCTRNGYYIGLHVDEYQDCFIKGV